MSDYIPTVGEDGTIALMPTDRVAVAVCGVEDGEAVGKVVQGRVASVEGDMVFVTFKGESEVKMYDRGDVIALYRRIPDELGGNIIPLAVSSKVR